MFGIGGGEQKGSGVRIGLGYLDLFSLFTDCLKKIDVRCVFS